ncbi:hypothetical protein FACS1894188_12850 [Clostridia bacterium]|nr:hypothetical protein FACS1894188_12850 [Clostridia bacterium]
MDRLYIQIREFYENCLPAAKANGYRAYGRMEVGNGSQLQKAMASTD